MSKLDVLSDLTIGKRVAEEEAEQLEQYFVETDQWRSIFSGEIDVVFGPKGSGKSALYTLLNRKESELFDKSILLAPAENIRGATVFTALVADPPPSELHFVYLWKLYCLTIIVNAIRGFGIRNEEADSLIQVLEEAGLLPNKGGLESLFQAAKNYIKKKVNRDVNSSEISVAFDSTSGMATVTKRSEYRDNASETEILQSIPVDELLRSANSSLNAANFKVWILFDRLDVAFVESVDLERNALRALFRTYADLRSSDNISLKIFVRDDIWKRIIDGGFREASHIINTVNISWSQQSLLNLLVRRMLANSSLVKFLGLDANEIRSNYSQQNELFYQLFPEKVDSGKNPNTFDWIVTRTMDGTRKPVPREVIHLVDVVRKNQIQRIERGEHFPEGVQFFDRQSIKEALPEVSSTRYEQTFLAENPDLAKYTNSLEGEKAEQTVASLMRVWDVNMDEALGLAKRLAEVGFFETHGTKEEPTFWVPFIYRAALNLVQGRAD